MHIRAPGKIILSGEHAVVYGAPALAMAIDRFSNVIVTVNQPNLNSHAQDIFVDLVDLNYQRKITFPELEFLRSQIEVRYEDFLGKKIKIGEVLQQPFELALCAAAYFFAKFDSADTAENFSLKLESNIPHGCGMGSSAAIITGILYALAASIKIRIEESDMLDLACEIENLQHGYSSGLDLLVAQHGGCILFAEGEIKKRKIPPMHMRFIQTGSAEVTTGECVAQVVQYFAYGKLAQDFAAVTYALDDALQVDDVVMVQKCIKENNKLLQHIGIVPVKVQEFIAKLEKRGLAAKICGAGACRGDGAGILLVVGEGNIDDYIADYGYSYLSLRGENSGVEVL